MMTLDARLELIRTAFANLPPAVRVSAEMGDDADAGPGVPMIVVEHRPAGALALSRRQAHLWIKHEESEPERFAAFVTASARAFARRLKPPADVPALLASLTSSDLFLPSLLGSESKRSLDDFLAVLCDPPRFEDASYLDQMNSHYDAFELCDKSADARSLVQQLWRAARTDFPRIGMGEPTDAWGVRQLPRLPDSYGARRLVYYDVYQRADQWRELGPDWELRPIGGQPPGVIQALDVVIRGPMSSGFKKRIRALEGPEGSIYPGLVGRFERLNATLEERAMEVGQEHRSAKFAEERGALAKKMAILAGRKQALAGPMNLLRVCEHYNLRRPTLAVIPSWGGDSSDTFVAFDFGSKSWRDWKLVRHRKALPLLTRNKEHESSPPTDPRMGDLLLRGASAESWSGAPP